ncbi:MAG: hypothetical protein KJN97_08075 [Deltaproteobacteria bacterium]|nr:hypothetical protein [Deltaproteobacteria bacterium]
MRAAVLVAIIALATPASAGEKNWSQVVAEWLDYYDLAVGIYTRDDFTSAAVKRGASCKAKGDSMVACSKKGSASYESASFGPEGRAHYFSLTLTTEESLKPCSEIGEHLKAKYGAPSYGVKGGGVGYNFPKKRRHIEFGQTRGVTGCILSIQAGVRSK